MNGLSDCENFVNLYKSLGGVDPRFLDVTPTQCCYSMAPQVICDGFPGDGEMGEVPMDTVQDPTKIVKLDLQAMGLRGNIPMTFTTLLPHLYFLNLGNNPGITGQVPNLGPNLKFLRVHNAALNGDLSQIGGMNGLLMLDLSNNQITGSIPTSISQLSNLRILDLSFNKLIGDIPGNQLSSIYPLLSLRLSTNALTGSLPSTGFMNLQKLDLSATLISGPLPSFNGRTLPLLDVSSTNINGQIPPALLQSATPSGTCPFTNSRLTLPPNTAAPGNCAGTPFNGQNNVQIPDQTNLQPSTTASPGFIGLILGIVGAVALLLILIGCGLIYLKRRREKSHADKIEGATYKPGMRPISTATFDTVGSSIYPEEEEEDDIPLTRPESIALPDSFRPEPIKRPDSVASVPVVSDARAGLTRPEPEAVQATRTSVRWSLAESV